MADLDRLGYKRVVFRSDNEAANVAFLNELKRHWQGEVVPKRRQPEILKATAQPKEASE